MYEQPASKVQAWRLPSDASVSKVGVLTVLVPRWLQIGALSLHWGSDWPVVFRIKLTKRTHPLSKHRWQEQLQHVPRHPFLCNLPNPS